MLNIDFSRDNAQLVKEQTKQKGYDADIDKLLKLDDDRRRLLGEAERVRAERNALADQLKQGKPSPEQIEKGKDLKVKLAELEQQLEPIEVEYIQLLMSVPN